jgi:hypothetical protein
LTCCAAFLRDRRLVLAADSRRLAGDCYDGRHVTDTDRKIRAAGPWHFVLGGFQGSVTGNGYRRRTVNLFEIIARAIEPVTTIEAAMRAIERAVTPVLRVEFAAGEPVPFLAVSVGGVQDGRLVLGHFRAAPDPERPRGVFAEWGTSLNGLERDSDGGITIVGSLLANGPAMRRARPPFPDWLRVGCAAAARRVIALDVEAAPELVGFPIRAVTITTDRGTYEETFTC